MKKNKLWFGGIICLIGGYMIFLKTYQAIDTGESPVISFEQERVEISVNDAPDILLNGMEAYDKEDGDLSGEIFVESISAFDTNQERMVTYAVFDSDRHVTKAVRKIHYSDYVKPRISLKNALFAGAIESPGIKKNIGAVSCVDGDISDKVVFDMQTAPDNNVHVNVAAKDSTGTTESLDLIYTIDHNIYTTDIILREYLVYINPGEMFDAAGNIESIKSNTEKENPAQYLEIDNPVNSNVPGVYEVIYSFNKQSDTGRTKCVVVVEENETKEGVKE